MLRMDQFTLCSNELSNIFKVLTRVMLISRARLNIICHGEKKNEIVGMQTDGFQSEWREECRPHIFFYRIL